MESAALIVGEPAKLPILGHQVQILIEVVDAWSRIKELEIERPRRDVLLDLLFRAWIEEVLLRGCCGVREASGPSERSASLEVVREPLSGFDLQRIIMGVARRGHRWLQAGNCGKG
jgi:hypothetical protein